MKYIISTATSVNDVYEKIQKSITDNKFGLMYTHNINEKLNSKGVELKNEYLVLDICNPFIAKEILDIDLSVGASLPCSLSIYSDNDKTFVCFTKPTALYPKLNDKLLDVSVKMEEALKKIISDAIN